MTTHDRTDQTARAIAADLDRERVELAANIDGLRDRLSVDALLGDALGYAKANMAPYARALDGAVRSNPLAAVMAGVGLAWLVLGRRSVPSRPEEPLAGTRFEALSRWEDEGGPSAPLPEVEDDDGWIAASDGMRHHATAALAGIDAAARARLRPAAELAAERAEVLAQLARDTRSALSQGLEGLTAAAQDRILATRETAYAARIAAVRQGARLIEERPMVAGAIGVAIGAAVAAALPRTRTEDQLFGAERDRLLSQAREALMIERARAERVASTLPDAVKTGADDAPAGRVDGAK